MSIGRTATGIVFEVAGPPTLEVAPVVLLHAGVADRRMWDVVWGDLTMDRPILRLDLRGFGESIAKPVGLLLHHADVLATMDSLDIQHAHVVGASMGAGVAVELALAAPDRVVSLLLVGPGGSLIEHPSEWLSAAWRAEVDALDVGDTDAAVEVNLRAWVDGPAREAREVDPDVRAFVGEMQRRIFEVTADWDDVEEDELDPAAVDRLADIAAPTLVLVGDGDVDTILEVAERAAEEIPNVRLVRWPVVAHMASMERAEEFVSLARDWFAANDS